MHGAVNATVVSWGVEGNKNFRVLAVCWECTDARMKNIQIQAQKCAGWRLSDWKDFLEDAKSTFLPPFAAHSFNNNANWVSVILDPVSYLQDQNGHSMLFPSQAWHLRVRFHEMTGLRNLFFVTRREIFLYKKFFLSRAKVNPWKPDDPAHNFPSVPNDRSSHRWPWNIDKVNIATASSSKKSNKRLACTPDHQAKRNNKQLLWRSCANGNKALVYVWLSQRSRYH